MKVTNNPYEILGIEKNATQEEIKKAFYQRSKEAHPDAGGSEEEQQQINQAYSLLSNALQRSQYDRTGTTEDYDTKHIDIIKKILEEIIDAPVKYSQDPLEVKKFIKSRIDAGKKAVIETQEKVREEIKKYDLIKSRIIKEPEPAYLTEMLNKRIYTCQIKIEEGELLKKAINKAYRFLIKYKFKEDNKGRERAMLGMIEAALGGI